MVNSDKCYSLIFLTSLIDNIRAFIVSIKCQKLANIVHLKNKDTQQMKKKIVVI